MLNRQFLSGVFRPERLNSTSTMKNLMENIVHSSIMRLGQDSLDKLYELMAMSIKFQFMSAPDAQSLFAITINHVDSWMQLTQDPEIMLQIQYSKDLLITVNASLIIIISFFFHFHQYFLDRKIIWHAICIALCKIFAMGVDDDST